MNQLTAPATVASSRSPSEAVVFAVAEAEGTSPLNLRPLATVVDPDELDRLVDSMTPRAGGPTGTITFSYVGYDVTVTERGDVSLERRHA